MKKSRIILSALLTIVLCVCLVSGATYALFTSESKVNIAVTSGKVEVEATIDGLQTTSLGKDTAVNGVFDNGGTATFTTSKELVLENVTPGDKATFNINIINSSNVAASYRIRMYIEGGLVDYLTAKATVLGKEETISTIESMTKWYAFNGKETIVVPMSVELPVQTGNEAQGKVAKISFAVEVIQGNAAGVILVDGKEYPTWEDAFAAAGANGTIQIAGTVELPGVPGTSQVTDLNGVTIEGLDFATLVFVNAEGSTVTGTGSFANFNLKNLMVVDETFYQAQNGENAWEFTYLEFEGTNEFVNVQFTDGIFVDGGVSTFKDCLFLGHNNDSSPYGNGTMYAAWVYSGEASFTNCEFKGTRGLKVADQYSGSDVTKVVVDGCKFGPLSEKPGIAVDNRLGALELIIKNSKFVSTQAGDAAEGGNGVAFVYENDNKTPNTTTIVCENNVIGIEVTNDAELAKAIELLNNNASTQDVEYLVSLAAGTYAGEYTIKQYPTWNGNVTTSNIINLSNVPFNKVVFEGEEGVVFTGVVNVVGNGNAKSGFQETNRYASTTFKNIKFDAANTELNADGDKWAVSLKAAASDVTFEGCTFANATHISTGGSANNAVGVINFVDCTLDNSGCISGYAKEVNISGCKGNAGNNGFVSIQGAGKVTVENSNITCDKYGFRTRTSLVIEVKNSTITVISSENPLVLFRDAASSATFTGCTLNCQVKYTGAGTFTEK